MRSLRIIQTGCTAPTDESRTAAALDADDSMQRVGLPSEVAEGVLWLLSPAAVHDGGDFWRWQWPATGASFLYILRQ